MAVAGSCNLEITDFKPLIRVIWGISGVPRPETITYAGIWHRDQDQGTGAQDSRYTSEG